MAESDLKVCTTSAHSVSLHIAKGDIKSALKSLSETKDGGEKLVERLDGILTRLKQLEKYNKAQQNDIARRIKENQDEESRLRSQRNSFQQTLSGKRAALSSAESSRRSAEHRRDSADRERRHAQARADELRSWWWVPVYGQIVLVRELIEDNAQREREARDEVNRYSNEISNLNSAISSYNQQIRSTSASLRSVENCLRNLHGRKAELEKAMSGLSSAIGDVIDAKFHWQESVNVTKHGNKSTSMMEKMTKLGSKKAIAFCSSKGVKTSLNAFESSWEQVEYVLSEAFQNKVAVDFCCSKCKKKKTELPYITSGDVFTCDSCF